MAKITRILAANICEQFFFVINTAVSIRCLVENFELICYSQRVNATSRYKDSGKVCSLLEWCFIISIDTCWDWFQRTYVLITAQKNL